VNAYGIMADTHHRLIAKLGLGDDIDDRRVRSGKADAGRLADEAASITSRSGGM
jgi:hypothetical protein